MLPLQNGCPSSLLCVCWRAGRAKAWEISWRDQQRRSSSHLGWARAEVLWRGMTELWSFTLTSWEWEVPTGGEAASCPSWSSAENQERKFMCLLLSFQKGAAGITHFLFVFLVSFSIDSLNILCTAAQCILCKRERLAHLSAEQCNFPRFLGRCWSQWLLVTPNIWIHLLLPVRDQQKDYTMKQLVSSGFKLLNTFSQLQLCLSLCLQQAFPSQRNCKSVIVYETADYWGGKMHLNIVHSRGLRYTSLSPCVRIYFLLTEDLAGKNNKKESTMPGQFIMPLNLLGFGGLVFCDWCFTDFIEKTVFIISMVLRIIWWFNSLEISFLFHLLISPLYKGEWFWNIFEKNEEIQDKWLRFWNVTTYFFGNPWRGWSDRQKYFIVASAWRTCSFRAAGALAQAPVLCSSFNPCRIPSPNYSILWLKMKISKSTTHLEKHKALVLASCKLLFTFIKLN